MQFFLDSASVDEVRDAVKTGLIDGITTNPSLIAKEGKDIKKTIAEICSLVEGPVSAEVVATNYEGMIEEGKKLAKIAENVCVKLPITMDGVRACKYFSTEGIMTNMTLCFSVNQALLVAKAGATYVSPFIGRLDDVSSDGMSLIAEIRMVYDNYIDFDTKILGASVRHPQHIADLAKVGSDVATMPLKVLYQLIKHPLTDAGLEQFLNDWKNSGISI